MSTADSIQVGGKHYKTSFEHWNLVAEAHLGYFEGQISKYLSRHSQKNGLQDVEKAEHFLMKLVELSRNGYPAMNSEAKTSTVQRYFEANPHIGPDERSVIMAVCFWTRTKHIEPSMKLIHAIKERYKKADAERQREDHARAEHQLDAQVAIDAGAYPTAGGYTDQAKDVR